MAKRPWRRPRSLRTSSPLALLGERGIRRFDGNAHDVNTRRAESAPESLMEPQRTGHTVWSQSHGLHVSRDDNTGVSGRAIVDELKFTRAPINQEKRFLDPLVCEELLHLEQVSDQIRRLEQRPHGDISNEL